MFVYGLEVMMMEVGEVLVMEGREKCVVEG